MIWRTPNGEYVVQMPIARLPDWAGAIHGPNLEPIQPARFYLVTPDGVVGKAFSEPIEYSVGDERGLTNIHAVAGDSLIAFHVVDHVSLGLRIESRVEITGLTPGEAGMAPSHLWDGIAAYEVAAAR